MQSQKTRRISTSTLTLGAVLTALVVVLALLSEWVPPLFGVAAINFTLIPVVIGGAKKGPLMGAWLGFVAGVVIMFLPSTMLFITASFGGTLVTVLVKGAVSGLVAACVYKLLEKKNQTLAVFAAAVVCPIVNTGIFLIGCLLFFMELVAGWAGDQNVAAYMFLGLAGFNFLFELGTNLLLSPAAVRILNAKMK